MAEHGHGHSVAAWTGVGILLVGSLVMSVAVVLTSLWLFIAGSVVCVLGVVAGKVLALAGYGQRKPDHTRATTAVR